MNKSEAKKTIQHEKMEAFKSHFNLCYRLEVILKQAESEGLNLTIGTDLKSGEKCFFFIKYSTLKKITEVAFPVLEEK